MQPIGGLPRFAAEVLAEEIGDIGLVVDNQDADAHAAVSAKPGTDGQRDCFVAPLLAVTWPFSSLRPPDGRPWRAVPGGSNLVEAVMPTSLRLPPGGCAAGVPTTAPSRSSGTPSMVRILPIVTVSGRAYSGSAVTSATCTTLPSIATRPVMVSRPGVMVRCRRRASSSTSAGWVATKRKASPSRMVTPQLSLLPNRAAVSSAPPNTRLQ